MSQLPGYALVAAGDEEAVLVQRQLQPLLGPVPGANGSVFLFVRGPVLVGIKKGNQQESHFVSLAGGGA